MNDLKTPTKEEEDQHHQIWIKEAEAFTDFLIKACLLLHIGAVALLVIGSLYYRSLCN